MPFVEQADITLYYAPKTRAFRMLWFLEELGQPYRIEQVDYDRLEHKSAEFLKLNPMGKLPTVVDDGAAVAETGAILVYLSDKYSAGDLAPHLDDPRRADFLRWLFFAAGVMEPAFGEKFFKWEVPPNRVAWGSFQSMENTIADGVSRRRWLLGDQFTAADVFVGANLHFGLLWKLFPAEGPIADYVRRCGERPALQSAMRLEERFTKEQEARKEG